jgi:hypothetical protein
VLTAGRALFVEQGYTATTIEQIAERAGVSKPTVFASVGSKKRLLKELLDIALAGDEQPIAVAERPWYQKVLHEPDRWRCLHLYAGIIVAMHERFADLDEVLKAGAASDSELQELWRASEDQRRTGASIIVDAVMQKGKLKANLTRNTAIDLVWFLNSSEPFRRFVRQCAWDPKHYEKWLGDTLCAQLLPNRPSARR